MSITGIKLKSASDRKTACWWLLSFSFFFVCTKLSAIEIGGYNPLSVVFYTPTTASSYLTTSSNLTIAGTCSSSQVTVYWNNDRGGSGAAGGSSWWYASGIILQPGQNTIRVLAYPDSGFGGSATLAVTYIPQPKLTITAPISGQRWSNSVFTVNGTSSASDASQITNIWYQLNNEAWTNAKGNTNWSAILNLAPGTNMVRAYAVDNYGLTSVTSSVTFDYVVTNRLAVQAFGLGKITPNYSNVWLEIGRNYSITSAPSAHFVFTNWVVSTNWVGGVKTYGKVLQFMMQSNMTLQVNFAETAKPAIAIKTHKTTGSLMDLTGTSSDVWGVAKVWYQLNGGIWNLAMTTNNWKNWTITLPLAAGKNTINAYAVSLGGCASPMKSVSVQSLNAFKLELGLASVKPTMNDGLNLSLQISPELNGTIEVSTDLVNWQTLTNFVGTNSTINFHDPAATNYSTRFYRLRSP